MFIASIQFPSIGQHRWLSFTSQTFVIDAEDREKALEEIRKILPEKDPVAQEYLCKQYNYLDDEYFEIRLHEVPKDKKIVFIYEPSTGFNEPYQTFRM
ncbi:hypothetical protein A2442_01165 [Candidatus Campbellbacteria bacterium RIFOXYC2_FULL_35_25]|uniref:Uncharacterized protein n=1 Tax=Candidatus Campbellbacteria bacterium RIFOXYC2_FULL_35_25 TaxID=1797582 RepID=A0A1F5EJH2_9BACT|nr:MAG: hypothetical protein A2442_01165 [Candidatus Campbellbacteria bacterium RIFOXYC2_FULL_35_25]